MYKITFGFRRDQKEYIPEFTIGNQTFALQNVESKKAVKWYHKMLKKAFNPQKKLSFNQCCDEIAKKWGLNNMKEFIAQGRPYYGNQDKFFEEVAKLYSSNPILDSDNKK